MRTPRTSLPYQPIAWSLWLLLFCEPETGAQKRCERLSLGILPFLRSLVVSRTVVYVEENAIYERALRFGAVFEPLLLALCFVFCNALFSALPYAPVLALALTILLSVLGYQSAIVLEVEEGRLRGRLRSLSSRLWTQLVCVDLPTILVLLSPFYFFYYVQPTIVEHQSIDLSLLALLFAGCARLALLLDVKHEALRGHTTEPVGRVQAPFVLHGLLLAVVVACASYLRFNNLDYNVAFIDELLNFEIAQIGNVDFIASDSRLWGMFAQWAQAQADLIGVRALTGVFGVSTVVFVYLLTLEIVRTFSSQRQLPFAPFVAALLFSFSAPALYISNLGTHDALSLMLFSFAFWLLARGCNEAKRFILLLSAALFFLSFASRYFILSILFTFVPYALYYVLCSKRDKLQSLHLVSWNLLPFAAAMGGYLAFNLVHFVGSVVLATNLSAPDADGGMLLTVSAVSVRMLPVLLVLLISLLIAPRVFSRRNLQEQSALFFLVFCTALLPVVHLANGSDFGVEKNLAYSLLFGCILAGIAFSWAVASRVNRIEVQAALTVALVLAFLPLQWLGTYTLLPLATRRPFAEQQQKSLAALRANPLGSLATAVVAVDQQRWCDPTPVWHLLTLKGLERQRVALFGHQIAEHINWYLTHKMGRDDKGEYFATPGTAWKSPFTYAIEHKFPVLLAILPEAELSPGEQIPEYPEFYVVSKVRLAGPEGEYGRVFLLVNPNWLAIDDLQGRSAAYFRAMNHLRVELPKVIDLRQQEKASEILSEVVEVANSHEHHQERFSLQVELAHWLNAVGRGAETRIYLKKAAALAARFPKPERYRATLNSRVEAERLFRTSADRGIDPKLDSIGKELLTFATPGSTAPREAARSNAKSYWLDFEPPLELAKGQVLSIETTLSRGDIRALRFVEEEHEFEEKGELVVLPFSRGRQLVHFFIPRDMKIKRIDDQVGPQAWGQLGGSLVAESTFHSVRISKQSKAGIFGVAKE